MHSPLQTDRLSYVPVIPSVLNETSYELKEYRLPPLTGSLATEFPVLASINAVQVVLTNPTETPQVPNPLRIGVVLSGGPAAGGHNVIYGLYNQLKQQNPENVLLGFIGGPIGIINANYTEITDASIARYRNLGGFDIVTTGRDKIETEEQFAKALNTCKTLHLNGLVVIGGDDSNTNAALMAEYFYNEQIFVVGCPKTIDGDLKNEQVQCSFGFDTACKTYSELIGNIMSDAVSSAKYYHFIRLMGRSASHITVECALSTHPNIALIGEEIASKHRTLAQITNMICDIIHERVESKGVNFGVILVPEGLIEFIPEVSQLINELNELLAANIPADQIRERLGIQSRELFDFLPSAIRNELMLERDPHGNVQVSKIETEKLLIELVSIELAKRKANGQYRGKFNAMSHFFGYEGRCALPSNFDCNYCFALGKTAAILLEHSATGMMATIDNLHLPMEHWLPGGYPFIRMMTEERRKGHMKPVIRKALVDLTGAPFTTLKKYRQIWARENFFLNPGPIQFYGPTADRITHTLQLESGGRFEQAHNIAIKLESKL